jgi:phosphoribosylglycinamide formyltransferase 1
VHLIDQTSDGGPMLLQAARPLDPSLSSAEIRHQVFVQQCKSLIQVIEWYEARRVRVEDGRTIVTRGRYEAGEFSPNLDSPAAIGFAPERTAS